MFKNFLAILAVKNKPLDEIMRKTSFFLGAQLKAMNQFDGNKFGFITFESLFYILAVAEGIGKRPIMQNECEKFFLYILGNEYQKRVNHLFDFLKSRDADEFTEIIRVVKETARADFEKGLFFGKSNFLVENAKFASLQQKKIKFDYSHPKSDDEIRHLIANLGDLKQSREYPNFTYGRMGDFVGSEGVSVEYFKDYSGMHFWITIGDFDYAVHVENLDRSKEDGGGIEITAHLDGVATKESELLDPIQL